jgi:hypothetical protein
MMLFDDEMMRIKSDCGYILVCFNSGLIFKSPASDSAINLVRAASKEQRAVSLKASDEVRNNNKRR